MVSLDVDLIDFYDKQIQKLDLYLEQHAKIDAADTFYRLQSIPGVGRILASPAGSLLNRVAAHAL